MPRKNPDYIDYLYPRRTIPGAKRKNTKTTTNDQGAANIFGGWRKVPDSLYNYINTTETPYTFAEDAPKMERYNTIHGRNTKGTSGMIFEQENPYSRPQHRFSRTRNRFGNDSSRGAGARKRLYKNEDEENDPRKRGKNFIENIKSQVKSTLVDPTVRGYNRAKDTVVGGYNRVKGGVVNRYNRAKDTVEGGYNRAKGAIEREKKAITAAPKFLREQYERGRTGKKVDQQNDAARIASKIGGTVGLAQGIDEGLGKVPSRILSSIGNAIISSKGNPFKLQRNFLNMALGRNQKMVEKRSASMGKRATAPKMARKTTAASSRQAGFVNGRPVSLKKRANTSMKYFK